MKVIYGHSGPPHNHEDHEDSVPVDERDRARPADIADLRASVYLAGLFDEEMVKRAAEKIRELVNANQMEMPEVMVGRGLSGIMAATLLSELLHTKLAIVRKHGAHSHSDSHVEGWLCDKYMVADDFISSGETVRSVIRDYEIAAKRAAHTPVCVGIATVTATDQVLTRKLYKPLKKWSSNKTIAKRLYGYKEPSLRRTVYLGKLFDPDFVSWFDELAKKLKDNNWIAAGCGLSGWIALAKLQARGGRTAYVRKEQEKTRASFAVEGYLGPEYVFVDDFICSGATMERTRSKLLENYDRVMRGRLELAEYRLLSSSPGADEEVMRLARLRDESTRMSRQCCYLHVELDQPVITR